VLLSLALLSAIAARIFNTQIDRWTDSLVTRYGSRTAVYILDYVANNPFKSFIYFAVIVILSLLVHAYVATLPQIASEKAEEPAKESPPAPVAEPKIKCVDVKSTSVFSLPFCVNENSLGEFSLYALFRNDPTEPLVEAAYAVKAHVVFLDGLKEVHSGFGTWIDRPENSVDFNLGDERRLLLVLLPFQAQAAYTLNNIRSAPMPRRNAREYVNAATTQTIKRYCLIPNELTISVTLIDSEGPCGNFKFEYRWNNGAPSITKID